MIGLGGGRNKIMTRTSFALWIQAIQNYYRHGLKQAFFLLEKILHLLGANFRRHQF